MKYDTILEAALAWVQEMDRIPQGIVEKLLSNCIDDVLEVTPPAKYDRVSIWETGESGEIVSRNDRGYLVQLDDGSRHYYAAEDLEVERDSYLPMWGTMWAFSESIDNDWLSGEFGEGGLQKMADCGFRIYEQEDYGYIFGIDGAGYDFFEAHWIPLYKARGLKWHKEEE